MTTTRSSRVAGRTGGDTGRRGGGRRARLTSALAGALGVTALAAPLGAQHAPPPCHVVCAPSLVAMPGMIRTHLFGGPTVRTIATGATHRLPSTSSLEVILVAAARTAVPRVSIVGSVQWLPNAQEGRNPFTLYTASELGGHVRANAPTATFALSGAVVTPQETGGWADLAANVGDLFSQAARPDDRSAYTHKLDLDLVAHAWPFAHWPAAEWLHGVGLYAILDYVATGLPRAGDEVPQGRTFVTAARPAALIAGLALPLSASTP